MTVHIIEINDFDNRGCLVYDDSDSISHAYNDMTVICMFIAVRVMLTQFTAWGIHSP